MGGTQAIRGKDGRGGLGNVLSGIAVAIGFALFLGGFAWGAVVYRPYMVPTDSMMPTVKPGDRVLAQRIDGADVHRGDVVIFTDSLWSDSPMVKRVVGIGGDVVKCCGAAGELTVNGTPLDEPYADTTKPETGLAMPPGQAAPTATPSRWRSPRATSSCWATGGPPPWTPGPTCRRQGRGPCPVRPSVPASTPWPGPP